MTTHDFTRRYVNMASPRLGARVVYSTDDFFAPKERLIDPEEPVFIPGKYDDNGKWMDGWESRRKRTPGHDHCIVKLGQAGVIHGVDIDTRHFTGNYPPAASLEACVSSDDIPGDEADWTELVPRTDLAGDSQHLLAVDSPIPWTHLRLHIFPDGGVARLRVYGRIFKDWSAADASETIDLLALENGGRPIYANNEHFGIVANLMAPGKGINMGDGWETRRRREPGNDWAVVELGHAGAIEEVLVDTAYFKGNYPAFVSLQAANIKSGNDDTLASESGEWTELLSKQPLTADAEHTFAPTGAIGTITHVRMNIFPDGGVSRLRLFGKPSLENE